MAGKDAPAIRDTHSDRLFKEVGIDGFESLLRIGGDPEESPRFLECRELLEHLGTQANVEMWKKLIRLLVTRWVDLMIAPAF